MRLLVLAAVATTLTVPFAVADHVPDAVFLQNGDCIWHSESVVLTPVCGFDEIDSIATAMETYIPLAYDAFAGGVNAGYAQMVAGYCFADTNGFLPDWYEIPPCADVPAGPILP